MIEHKSLPVFLFSACIRNREKEGGINPEQKKAQTWDLKLYFKQPQNIYNYTVCENMALLPWIHPCTAMACKQCCQPLSTAANWVMVGGKQKCWPWRLSAILQVWEPQWLHPTAALMGEGIFFFFSKSLAQVGTPCCCSSAKSNKPPKNGYGGKFPLLSGGSL